MFKKQFDGRLKLGNHFKHVESDVSGPSNRMESNGIFHIYDYSLLSKMDFKLFEAGFMCYKMAKSLFSLLAVRFPFPTQHYGLIITR